ncbi:MAG TPA: BatA domain-containing protein, partial [Tepidisphaeraceae bacterium]|nr:BatA domain-containing protein [Tepidisphaeraceae bacterium]
MIRFLNPILLAGLAAVVVPVVLHLLSRSRFRSVEWGAMLFLPGGDSRRPQASRLRQWALLLIRSALIGVLAVTLALPVVRAGHPSGAEFAAIILDRSASMGWIENGQSRLERARETAMNVLASLRAGDQAALLTVGGDDPEPTTSSDLQSVAQQILATSLGTGRADLAAALMQAVKLCNQHPRMNGQIFIVSDRQAGNWQGFDADFLRQWNKQSHPPVTWMPIGTTTADNVGIDSIDFLNPPAIRGLAAEIAVHVHNYGIAAHGPIHLTLDSDNQQLAEAHFTLAPREQRSIIFAIHFPHVGPIELSASIDTDDLTSDNTRPYVLDVVDRLPVLIISGDQRPGRFRSEADFLQLALCPFSDGKADDPRNPCTVHTIDADHWDEHSLDGQRVAILANVPTISPDQVRALEQFSYAGGGVIIAPGNLVHPDDYNQNLYRNGTGILP